MSASNEAAESAQDARKALLQQLEGSAAHETATPKAQLRLSTQEMEAARSQDNRVQLMKEFEASADSAYSEMLKFQGRLTKAKASADSAVNRLQRLLKGA